MRRRRKINSQLCTDDAQGRRGQRYQTGCLWTPWIVISFIGGRSNAEPGLGMEWAPMLWRMKETVREPHLQPWSQLRAFHCEAEGKYPHRSAWIETQPGYGLVPPCTAIYLTCCIAGTELLCSGSTIGLINGMAGWPYIPLRKSYIGEHESDQ